MILNHFPIEFDFEDYQVSTTPYSDEKLKELRANHNDEYSFFRYGDDIIISNSTDIDQKLSGQVKTLNLLEDSKATAGLIRHIFFRTFKDRFRGFIPVDFSPFRLYSSREDDDLIRPYLSESLKGKIAYKKLIELHLREDGIEGRRHFSFLVNLKRNWVFNLSCRELHETGFDFTGMEILHSERLPGLEGILAPNEEFIGELVKINGEQAIVKTNDGNISYNLDELFLRKTKFNIQQYLEFVYSPAEAQSILNAVRKENIRRLDAKSQYDEILKSGKAFFADRTNEQILFQNMDGFCFRVSSKPNSANRSIELKTPTFIYDHAGTQTDNRNPDIGLSNYGPYDSAVFTHNSPNVLCICHGGSRGDFTRFLQDLVNGQPNSVRYKKGFQKKYELNKVNMSVIDINDYSLPEYQKVIRVYLEDKMPDLAIIEIPDRFQQLPDIENPYFTLKAKLLSLEVPAQFIKTSKVRKYNEFILNTLALQLYAKLGGTPWVLPAPKSVDREIVVGIGHSWVRSNQYSNAQSHRIVGITTFMSGDGQYLLADKVKEVPFDNYFQELLVSLEASIMKLSEEQAWENGNTVRLIFHIFKPIKNVEFDVVVELVKKLPQFRIKFAFVTISDKHPHLLFDPTQDGIKKHYSDEIIGRFIPKRGENVFINTRTCLIQMLGATELKTSKHSMSNPMQVKILTPSENHKNPELNELLFYDLEYISRQVFSFTYLSWRSFLAQERPATMLYSVLIARLLGKMRNIPGWDPDALNYTLKRKKWFL
ncbi:Piwi domain protein [bacterium]|nr:Piwi domain protein [bacterium]